MLYAPAPASGAAIATTTGRSMPAASANGPPGPGATMAELLSKLVSEPPAPGVRLSVSKRMFIFGIVTDVAPVFTRSVAAAVTVQPRRLPELSVTVVVPRFEVTCDNAATEPDTGAGFAGV